MKKGSDYQAGELLTQGPYSEPIRLVWYDDRIPDDVFLVTGASRAYLTVYVTKADVRMAPRLARFIPMDLFEEIVKITDTIPDKAKRVPKKNKPKNVLQEATEKPVPTPTAPPPRNRRKVAQEPSKRRPRRIVNEEPPAPRKRVQKRRRRS